MDLIELAEWMGRSTLVVGAFTIVLFVFAEKLSAAARFSIWTALFFLVIASWFARDLLPRWEILPFEVAAQEVVHSVESSSAEIAPPALPLVESGTGPMESLVNSVAAPVDAVSTISPWQVLWSLGGLLLLLRVALSYGFLVRQRKEFPEDHAAYVSLRVLARQFGIRRTIRLVEKKGSPMTWGIGRVYISLPKDCGSWSGERLELALRHELAHVKRADVLWLFLTQVALSLFWFHPALWWITRRLRIEREKAADEAVLNQGVSAEDYAGLVLEFSRLRPTLIEPVALCGIASNGQGRVVEDRVRNILANRSPIDAGKKRGIAVAVVIGMLAVSGLAFCLEGQQSVVPKSPTVLPGVRNDDPGEEKKSEDPASEESAPSAPETGKRLTAVRNPEYQIVTANPAGTVLMADGFDYPVGGPNGEGYYVYRGFTPNDHLGEDWSGNGGGNTDLGDPVKSVANGYVVYADDFKKGWGNVVIIRHTYLSEGGVPRQIDSVYGMMNRIDVEPGEVVKRGQQVGTIGRGPHNMYVAHLHFELRKNINILMDRASYARDYSNYFSPSAFIKAHRG